MSLKKISPSVMCARLDQFAETLRVFKREGVEYLHIDVMDGEFVPNFAIGIDFICQLRKLTSIPLDIHLMVTAPERKIGWLSLQEGEYCSVHAESTPHLQKALKEISACGAKPMAALNPATSVSVLDYVLEDLAGVLVMTVNPGFAGQKMVPQTLQKIADVREYLNVHGRPDVEIEVDGNVSFENAVAMSQKGADIFVAGSSSVFSPCFELDAGIQKLREAIG